VGGRRGGGGTSRDNLSFCFYVIFKGGRDEFVGSVRFKGSFSEEYFMYVFRTF